MFGPTLPLPRQLPNAEKEARDIRPSSLSSFFESRLPREIRDAIYAHLWDDGNFCHTLSLLSPACKRKNKENCSCEFPEGWPIFAQPGKVGYSFAYEAVVWLYNNQNFRIVGPDYGTDLFTSDVFHLGIGPDVVCIRRLSITFDMDHEKMSGPAKGNAVNPFRFLLMARYAPDAIITVTYVVYTEDFLGHAMNSGVSLGLLRPVGALLDVVCLLVQEKQVSVAWVVSGLERLQGLGQWIQGFWDRAFKIERDFFPHKSPPGRTVYSFHESVDRPAQFIVTSCELLTRSTDS